MSRFIFTPKSLPIPTDYLNGENTAILDNEAIGALLRLALVATGSPNCNLPDDDVKLAAISRLGDDWPRHSAGIRACLEPDPEESGRLILPLAMEERHRYEAWCLKSSKGGSAKRKSEGRVVEPPSKGGATLPTYPPSSLPTSLSTNPSTSPPAAAREEEEEGGSTREKGDGRRRVTLEDLKDPAKLEALREGAIRKGYINQSDADRLRYHAAGIHALKEGDNPVALFISIVTKGQWHLLTDSDDDEAQRRLKELDGRTSHGPRVPSNLERLPVPGCGKP